MEGIFIFFVEVFKKVLEFAKNKLIKKILGTNKDLKEKKDSCGNNCQIIDSITINGDNNTVVINVNNKESS